MPTTLTDRQVEDQVLTICRAKTGAIWCMRDLSPRHPSYHKGRCAIVDNRCWNAPIVAQGNTWAEVLTAILAIGA